MACMTSDLPWFPVEILESLKGTHRRIPDYINMALNIHLYTQARCIQALTVMIKICKWIVKHTNGSVMKLESGLYYMCPLLYSEESASSVLNEVWIKVITHYYMYVIHHYYYYIVTNN